MKNTKISYPVGTKVILPNGIATITETQIEPHPIPKRDISFYKVKYDDIEKNNEYEKDMLYTNKDFFIMTPERKALIDYAESKEWDWQEVNEHFLIHEQANSKNNDTQMTIIIWHENLSFQATSYKEDEHETTSYEVPLDLGELIINYMRSLKEEAKNDINEWDTLSRKQKEDLYNVYVRAGNKDRENRDVLIRKMVWSFEVNKEFTLGDIKDKLENENITDDDILNNLYSLKDIGILEECLFSFRKIK